MDERIQVTIVGAGHYGRELVAQKYRNNKSCRIKSVISPTVSRETLEKSVLKDVPLYRDSLEWQEASGTPSQRDVFELAVHYHALPAILKELTSIGARNFVLPKPIALEHEKLRYIQTLQKKYGLNCAVASQWHYSEVTSLTGKYVKEMKRKGALSRVQFDFSQPFSDEQLKQYSSRTALLPHILQIIYSVGLSGLHKTEIGLKKSSQDYLACSIMGYNTVIDIVSDLRAPERVRIMKTGELTSDFLAVFRNGKAVQYPSVTYQNNTARIKEDNLQLMTDSIIDAFLHHPDISKDRKVLTLERYMPVAQFQADLEQDIKKR